MALASSLEPSDKAVSWAGVSNTNRFLISLYWRSMVAFLTLRRRFSEDTAALTSSQSWDFWYSAARVIVSGISEEALVKEKLYGEDGGKAC